MASRIPIRAFIPGAPQCRRAARHLLLMLGCILLAGAELPPDWAFHPPSRPAIPNPALHPDGANEIDAFVLHALEQRNIAPSPEAAPAALVRRLYLDVLGLPPSPRQVQNFVEDPSPGAWASMVDEVLASPHFGERWARHWLDVVRFAETNGYETNTPRRNAWHYRDYVIRALNEDIPYTQFIAEQLAGDALGEHAATGFLVGGPSDEVKSPDIVLTKNQRDADLNDMTATTGTAFLGLTVGCAKCHDHKFDPISQRDYFAMRAVFEGVRHGEREIQPPDAGRRREEARSLRERLEDTQQRLARHVLKARVGEEYATDLPRRASVHPKLNTERFDPVLARFVRFTVLETNSSEPCIDELEIFGEGGTNLALAESGARATASSEYPANEIHRIAHLNDGRFGNGRSWIPALGEVEAWAQIELPRPARVERIVWARDRSGAFTDRLATRYRIEVAVVPGEWTLVASADDRAAFEPSEQEPQEVYDTFSDPVKARHVARLAKRARSLEEQVRALETVPRIYAGTFEEPGPTFLLHRGDPMFETEPVAPAGLGRVAPAFALPPDTPEQERRIALARWLGSRDNPLTARVMVNRIWKHHFGRGLVDSPSDFGKMGARPTHPELLDWLAMEFMDSGWKMKHIHRLILLSRTYRQSSAPRQEALAIDAESRLLWRFPPRRLEAEPIRDAILAVSGALDLAMGGPGYEVFEPNDNYVHVYVPKREWGPPEWRRMIYQFKPRMQQDETFGAFDCPDASQPEAKRNTSTTPLQALNMLNSPFLMQQAGLLAKRLEREAGAALPAKLRQAYSLALGREPQGDELKIATEFAAEHGIEAFCRALYNTSEFLYLQ